VQHDFVVEHKLVATKTHQSYKGAVEIKAPTFQIPHTPFVVFLVYFGPPGTRMDQCVQKTKYKWLQKSSIEYTYKGNPNHVYYNMYTEHGCFAVAVWLPHKWWHNLCVAAGREQPVLIM
jgi:hypothetical protein